jgi:hypothetical protein
MRWVYAVNVVISILNAEDHRGDWWGLLFAVGAVVFLRVGFGTANANPGAEPNSPDGQ